MNNIIDQVLHESIQYVKRMNVQEYFTHLLERYLSYHKKGIYVHFNFASSSKRACFEHYITRFGLNRSLLEGVPEKEKRNTRLEIHYVRDKLNSKMRSLQMTNDKWRKELRDLESKIKESYASEKADVQYSKVQKALLSIYQDHEQIANAGLERANMEVNAIHAMENRYIRLSKDIQEKEMMILVLVLNFYMDRLQERVRLMFPGKEVFVRFSRHEVLKRYKEKKAQHNNSISLYPDPNHEYSIFERELFGFMDIAKKMFVIYIHKDDEVYKLRSSESQSLFQVSIEPKGSERYAQYDRSFYEPLNQFFKKYEGFSLLLNSLIKVQNIFGEDVPACDDIVQVIQMAYPKEVITKYGDLQKEMAKKLEEENEKKPNWISGEQAIDRMIETFPELLFHSGVKEDENMNFAMSRFGGNEKYYIHYIDEISSQTDVLKLAI
ncbi:hypothetical protein ACFVS2_25110 [Brevibacillus sp. NPDC058079]|uniref:hypothetical protein n=1 Tax=Brevibacillus sp. NPDC058079 TaxID=3346330 RepID=UPI0036E0FE59